MENEFSEFREHFENEFIIKKALEENITFTKEKHVIYLKYILHNLKKHYTMDSHKMTILYFIVGGLKILKSLSEEEKNLSLIFVLSNAIIKNDQVMGFRGGNFTGWTHNYEYLDHNREDIPHIAATYCALAIIKMCGFNKFELIESKLRKIHNNENIIYNPDCIIQEILECQNSKGQIRAQNFDTENDVRFFYCAMSIFKLLDKSAEEIKTLINFENSLKFLHSIKTYEGGFSMIESGESNAGTTFCAIASFKILEIEIPEENKLIYWLNNRNTQLGVNGRTNKLPDSCYSFWVLASLFNLKLNELFDTKHTTEFVLNCQTDKGGFSKHLNLDGFEDPDLLHTFYSLASLSLMNYDTLNKFDSLLAISIE